jgi:hypothetical protein
MNETATGPATSLRVRALVDRIGVQAAADALAVAPNTLRRLAAGKTCNHHVIASVRSTLDRLDAVRP